MELGSGSKQAAINRIASFNTEKRLLHISGPRTPLAKPGNNKEKKRGVPVGKNAARKQNKRPTK